MHKSLNYRASESVKRNLLPLLGLLFLFSLLLRVTGLITFVNGDEHWSASVRVLAGDLSGGAGLNPPLINYINAGAFGILYGLGRTVGVWQSTEDFRTQYFTDPSPFVFAGRFAAASLSALCAPIAASIASHFLAKTSSCFVVGTLVALLPINVLLSHFARPDAVAAMTILLLCWAILRKLSSPDNRASDTFIGATLAFALSIKQTNLLIVAPILVGYLGLLRFESKYSWTKLIKHVLFVTVIAVPIAILLNIGIIIDIQSFLDYQRVSVTLNRRSGDWSAFTSSALDFGTKTVSGLTAAGMVAFFLSLYWCRDFKFLLFSLSSIFGFITFCIVSGQSIVPRYVHPYVVLAFCMACIGLMQLIEGTKSGRLVGVVVLAALLPSVLYGTFVVSRQALAAPIGSNAIEIIRANVVAETDKILAHTPGITLRGLPIKAAAREDEDLRHKRLGIKYGQKLADRASRPMGLLSSSDQNSYYVRAFPFAMGGMQDISDEDAAKAVKPYYWPIQNEEWELEYWLKTGFSIFVISGEDAWLNSKVNAYQKLHMQINAACTPLAVIPTVRSYFFEEEVKVYRCKSK
jgi:hypothetical protein